MNEIPQLTRAKQRQIGRIDEATVKFAKIRQRALRKKSPNKAIGEFAINIAKRGEGFVLIDGQPYQIATSIHTKHLNQFSMEEQKEILRRLEAMISM